MHIQKDTKDYIIRLLMKHKKTILYHFIFITLLLLLIIAVHHNYRFYHDTIAKITKVDITYDHEEQDENGGIEKYYMQNIKAILLNSKWKGKTVTLNNIYGSSEVYDNKYKKGDEVFITTKIDKNYQITGVITGLKRDTLMVILLAAFIYFVCLVALKKGFFTLITLFINICMFSYALDLYLKGSDIMLLSILASIFFTVFSLFLISGFNKKTFATILSTLISVGLTMVIFQIVLSYNRIDYASMEYLTMPNDVENIFMAEILIGGLGAIMDIAITMAAATSELVEKDSTISTKELIKSGKEIGNDIMGTMINVLLFTFICGSIPFFILAMKNGIHIKNILTIYMSYEIYRFLTGSIGILLSIPISITLSILMLKKRKVSL